ncbi:MAG TPA: TonB-dependent receptor [Rubricoccaceae bacterium]|nr:TonB-dependent receptor [Rubricoccaceae bacterium]
MRASRLLLFILGLLAAGPALAQGRIAGQVTDAETGETLPGVNVVVLGTSRGAATDIDGRYLITDLRAGEYTVQVTSVGYETRQYTAIRVRNGETTTLDVVLGEAAAVQEEVVVVGERPLIDVEQSASTVSVTREQIEAAPVREVQQIVAQQAGVVSDPTGLYIRGGRADETGLLVDGVSAKDPLAGTGFGLDLGSNAFAEVEVTTGGSGADVGDATSGVVRVTTRDGTDELQGSFTHRRDHLGFNEDWASTWNEEVYEGTLSGPILPGRLRFFLSGQVQLTDDYTRFLSTPDQLRSTLVDGTFFLPRADNRWSGLGKLTFLPRNGMRLRASYQRSLTVNQNTRMLQVTGNDDAIRPGFQYAFVLQPDNANTFAHDNNLGYLRWSHALGDQSFYEVQVSRLFTRLRADANGRPWRPDTVSTELDPASIPLYPGELFVDEEGNPVDPNVQFVLPGPGFFNNGGIATRWHDHFAEELTLRGTFSRFNATRTYELSVGVDARANDYQWIDILRPWIGAPIIVDGDTVASNRLGEASDVWRVKPRRVALFTEHQFRYRGLIATLGLRGEAWAPGRYVDDLVEQNVYTIPEPLREAYRNETFGLLGLRWKARLLPKVRVSFPVRENQVLFFNYGHSMRLPHPTFLYTNLDPFYQDRSFFGDLGNPNLNPEVDISYELGFRNQITSDDALTVTAFWRDKFDFITAERVTVRDATGRETTRALRVNGDYARVRGLEVSYVKRISDWFRGDLNASYSRATGLASTNNEALRDLIQTGNADNTAETPLAWDRPFDVKAATTFMWDRERPLFGVPGLNRFRVYLSTTFRSGQRYTPVRFVGNETNPFTGEQDWRPIYETVSDRELRYSEVGKAWWWFDLSAQRRVRFAGTDLRFSLEITNLFNQKNGVLINPVTGEAYPDVEAGFDFTSVRGDARYDVPNDVRDPRFEDPSTTGLPPLNPARFLPPRHVMLGLSFDF